MEGYEAKEALSIDAFEVEEGAYCETTKRVVIISPFPSSIRALVLALTIRCYDVLVFHHENDPALNAIQADAWIIDRTRAVSVDPNTFVSSNEILVLVGDAQQAAASEQPSMVWPCPVQSVLARLEEITARTTAVISPELLKYKDITVDLKRVTVQQGNQKIDLTKTEFDLLKLLLSAGGAVLSRQDIMKELWGDNYFGGSNSVDVHIKSLRQKLGDDPKNPSYITTVRGVGYRLSD